MVSFDQQERSLRKWLTDFGVEERQYTLLQDIDANKDKDNVFEQISDILNKVLENKQIEKSSMREMLVIKIKQMIEEKQKLITSQEALSAVENADNSLQDGDMNRTGEISKMSKDVDTARKSKDKSATDAPVDPAQEANKSGLSATLSAASLVVLPERDNIDNDFKPVIIEVWRDLAKNYKSQMKRIFRNIRM